MEIERFSPCLPYEITVVSYHARIYGLSAWETLRSHTTHCVFSTERDHCLTEHRSIHNDRSVAVNGEMYVSLLC